MQPITIIGSGLAGYSLAREFRRRDQTTPLRIITGDNGHFYSKPMLSNALAQGKDSEALTLNLATEMAHSLNAEIITHTPVTGIDHRENTIQTRQKEYHYSTLVFATGASPIRLPIKGTAASQVIAVNSLEDYTLFREKLEQAKNIAIIGPGLIGCEFANDLLHTDRSVAVIGPDPYPLSMLLPETAGKALQASLESAGVDWHLKTVVEQIDRNDTRFRLSLNNGSQISADLVLSAAGLRPNTALAKAAGINIGRGLRTDRYLQTNIPNIFALGDCAEIDGLIQPYVAPLMIGAKALAKTLTGERTQVTYPAMPVVIKTSTCPVVALPPDTVRNGDWQHDITERGTVSRYLSSDGQLRGFALTGATTAEKQSLMEQLPR